MNSSGTLTTQSESDDNLKTYFFTNESFTLLRKAQEIIFQKTGFSPSLKKLVNTMINHESVEQLTNQFVENLK